MAITYDLMKDVLKIFKESYAPDELRKMARSIRLMGAGEKNIDPQAKQLIDSIWLQIGSETKESLLHIAEVLSLIENKPNHMLKILGGPIICGDGISSRGVEIFEKKEKGETV